VLLDENLDPQHVVLDPRGRHHRDSVASIRQIAASARKLCRLPVPSAQPSILTRGSALVTGRQETNGPPSAWVDDIRSIERGESIDWTDECDAAEEPRIVTAEELRDRVASLAIAILCLRFAGAIQTEEWLRGGAFPTLPCEPRQLARRWIGAKKGASRRWAPSTPQVRGRSVASDFTSAAARYNADNARELPRSGTGDCPICGHRDCFGELPESGGRWSCFSASHDGAGVQGVVCWTGDALDLDAHAAGVTRGALLRWAGYLAAGGSRAA
jgi:hypothetical protein